MLAGFGTASARAPSIPWNGSARVWGLLESRRTHPEYFDLMFSTLVPSLTRLPTFEFFQDTTARAEADIRLIDRGQFRSADPAAACTLWVGMLWLRPIALSTLAPRKSRRARPHLLEAVLAGFHEYRRLVASDFGFTTRTASHESDTQPCVLYFVVRRPCALPRPKVSGYHQELPIGRLSEIRGLGYGLGLVALLALFRHPRAAVLNGASSAASPATRVDVAPLTVACRPRIRAPDLRN